MPTTTAVPSNERLAPFFTWAEFDVDHHHPLKRRDWNAYEHLVQVYLTPLRRRFGRTIVHSSRRTKGYNAAVGGAPRSLHLTTSPASVAAADVSCERGTPHEWGMFLRALGAGGIGIYADHVHVDTRRQRAMWHG